MANARRLFVVCGLLLFIASNAAAATRTWAGTSGNWTNPANWVGGVAPAPGDDLVFPSGPGGYIATNDFPALTPFASLTFPAGAGARTIAGNSILLGAGGITARDIIRVNTPLTLGADQSWDVSGEGIVTLILGAPTDINGRTLTVDLGNNIDWSFGLAGPGQVIINGGHAVIADSTGPSSLTLNGVFARVGTHPGPIVVNGGPEPDLRRGLTLGCGTRGPVTVNGDTLLPESSSTFVCRPAEAGDLLLGPAATFGGYPLDVTGTVSLGGARLRLYDFDGQPFDPPADIGQVVTIIDNDGSDPVSGTFANLPEGGIVRAEGTNRYFAISYHGGDGNDVTLLEVAEPAGTSYVVTNLNDSGAGSLRQAVANANVGPAPDTITFATGLTGTIVLTSGEIAISDSVSILGPQGGGIAVSGNNASRVFTIEADEVHLAHLTLTAGRASYGGLVRAQVTDLAIANVTFSNGTAVTGSGGALYVFRKNFPDALRITGSTFTGNSASAMGGALYSDLDRFELDHVVMTNNQAGARGGGLHHLAANAGRNGPGWTIVTHSTFTGNQACLQLQPVACGGGGLSVVGFDQQEDMFGGLSLTASTVSGNTATPANNGLGGGVFCSGEGRSPCDIIRSTVAGNTAAEGGGVYTDPLGLLLNSTIVNNSATGAGGGAVIGTGTVSSSTVTGNSAGGDGGGLFFKGPSRFGSRVGTIVNSIVADNVTPAGTPDVAGYGDIHVNHSLIRTPGTAVLILEAGVITGQDPLLGPLATDPGSPTATRDPLPGSPVINSGDPAFSETTVDQRYYPRVAGGRIDMGAVEVQPAPANADLALTAFGAAFLAGDPGSYTIRVTNNGPASATNVTVTDGPIAGATLLGADATQGTCTVTTTVNCSLGALTPNASATITVFVVFPAPGSYPATATAASATPDPAGANNSATRSFNVTAPAPPPAAFDLQLTGSAAQQGTQLVYTFVVTNNGPGTAQDVELHDPLPPGTSFVSATASPGTCTNANGVVTCTLGDLAAGATATVTITLAQSGPGEVVNSATVVAGGTGGVGETTFTNNVATVVFESHGEPHIPTLGEWMLMLLAALLGLAACLVLRGQ